MTAVFSLILCGQLFCSVIERGLTANECTARRSFYAEYIGDNEVTYCMATKYIIKD